MWNYRIVKHRHRNYTWYGLHEVFYKKNGKIDMWAPRPDAQGDTVADLLAGLGLQIRDATMENVPILDEKDLPGWKKEPATCENCGGTWRRPAGERKLVQK